MKSIRLIMGLVVMAFMFCIGCATPAMAEPGKAPTQKITDSKLVCYNNLSKVVEQTKKLDSKWFNENQGPSAEKQFKKIVSKLACSSEFEGLSKIAEMLAALGETAKNHKPIDQNMKVSEIWDSLSNMAGQETLDWRLGSVADDVSKDINEAILKRVDELIGS